MKRSIKSGLYIVVNPAQEKEEIINQLKKIKNEAIAAIQIWDNPNLESIDEQLLDEIIQLFKNKTPVLINNKWELMADFAFDGVHFDQIPQDFQAIQNQIKYDFIKGVTLENDLSVVKKAEQLNFDYLSFCAMFPSKTTDACKIVRPETIKKCREMTTMPIFLSGGITPINMNKLKDLSFEGIAVVSGIMNADNPQDVFKQYELELKQ